MNRITSLTLSPDQAALWFLGQAGYVIQTSDVLLAIDPYLTDSVGAVAPDFTRAIPVPLEPEELHVDIYIVTHDHLDHLDPETIARYPHKATTDFVAPRFAARKLVALGIPRERITVLDHGETATVRGVSITGVFALATGRDVLDTTGYHIVLPNDRNCYHPSDTAYCSLLLADAPHAEVLLTPINGKMGNLSVEQAIELTAKVQPRYVMPNHYDLMALNAENPEYFRYCCQTRRLTAECVITTIMQPFIWK